MGYISVSSLLCQVLAVGVPVGRGCQRDVYWYFYNSYPDARVSRCVYVWMQMCLCLWYPDMQIFRYGYLRDIYKLWDHLGLHASDFHNITIAILVLVFITCSKIKHHLLETRLGVKWRKAYLLSHKSDEIYVFYECKASTFVIVDN